MDPHHGQLSMRLQCELLGVNRYMMYYEPRGANELNLEVMRLMDEHSLNHAYKGSSMHACVVGS